MSAVEIGAVVNSVYFDKCCMVFREELISYYKELSDAAELRATKARWRVRRHRLDKKRTELFQSETSWTSSADEV